MITEYEEIEHTKNDQKFKIKTWKDDDVIHVKAYFHDGEPANPFTYKVAAEVDDEFFSNHRIPGVEKLQDAAIRDIEDGYIKGEIF